MTNINILVPMAGLGTRFADKGYTLPKPLIDIEGQPMIKRVVDSLSIDGHYIFIVQKEHYETYDLQTILENIAPGCDIVQVDGITEGAAVTTLAAKELINNELPLVIANSDQIIEWNSEEFVTIVTDLINNDGMVMGTIPVFASEDPKWSYAALQDGMVNRVAEKEVISNNATVGVYGWRTGAEYVQAAEQMIANNTRTNNEFYICPVYNEAFAEGKLATIFYVSRMFGVGTPEDLENYLAKDRS